MSQSPRDPSPVSESTGDQLTMARDNFAIELPSPRLNVATHGTNGTLKSPSTFSPDSRRGLSFSREGILGSAQKARNLSQSSGDRDSATAALQTSQKDSDDGINPLKRRSTDAGTDYPRRRATIAVCASGSQHWCLLLMDFIV